MKEAKRRPIVATVLSLFSPGLGHMYCGCLRQALSWSILYLALGYALTKLMDHWDTAPVNVVLPVALFVALWVAIAVRALALARRQSPAFVLRKYNRWYWYVLFALTAETISLATIPAFGRYESYNIPGSGMENSLYPGDVVLSDNWAYESHDPGTGDVVIFIFPGDGRTKYIKRCAAVPGDTVEIKNKYLHINGLRVEGPEWIKHIDTLRNGEQNIQLRDETGRDTRDNFGPYVVPEDHFFVMGDNRDNSYDSRYWKSVPRELVLGKALRIVWSPDWSRLGLSID